MAKVEFSARSLTKANMTNSAGETVDILDDLEDADITFSFATPQTPRARHGDSSLRYVKEAVKEGYVRFQGRATVDDGDANTLYDITVLDDSGVRTFEFAVDVGSNKGFDITGSAIIQGNPGPEFAINPSTRNAQLRSLVLLTAGSDWTLSRTVS